jgi:predicted nucleic acid-binding protein
VTPFVIDASVAVKWLPLFAHEPYIVEAQRFRDRSDSGEIALLVPGLFWIEVASILWKAARRGACLPIEAKMALDSLRGLGLSTFYSDELLSAALALALRHNRSVYDSLYVALAVRLHAQFVTADEKLANALVGVLPVKWLGVI